MDSDPFDIDDDTALGSIKTAGYLLTMVVLCAVSAMAMICKAAWHFCLGEWR